MSRPIGALLKEHAVLVAGIALPVLLIILFSVARALPSKTVADPVYDAVFAVQQYYGGYNFSVKDEKLEVTYTPPKDNYAPPNAEKPKILIYNGAKDSATSITLEAPKTEKDETKVPVTVKEFSDLKLTDAGQAPDGYTFERQSWSSGSFVADMFTYNNHHTPNALVKDGRIIPVTPLKNNYYGDITFIGWVKK